MSELINVILVKTMGCFIPSWQTFSWIIVSIQRDMKMEEPLCTADGVQTHTAVLEWNLVVPGQIKYVSLLRIYSKGMDAEDVQGMY